ncbi:hypothetical protein CRG98_019899 [Punica granatum]|uniref:Aminotransferase-like plant mobile domain-containing protein n=1 Tax=Punica granatum TaxID=22663 RepID=A0A2I0JV53_PUNGR|nr:hypothetical protein CRG98_019899 [Punica granatum]
MDHSHPYLRLDAIIIPTADIIRLWTTFRPVDRAFLKLIIGDLPLLADSLIDWTMLRTAINFWDTQRAVFDFQGIELALISRLGILLGLRDEEVRGELKNGWEHSVRTAWLVNFIHIHALYATGESYQRDACHGFLLLIFGIILFSYSSNLIDGGTCPSHPPSEVRRGRMRGSPNLLQIWLLAHIRPFCSSRPFSYITDERSLIARLLHVFRPSERDYIDWKQFMEELTPAQFLWAARWSFGGPMAIGCLSVIGLPLISHLRSTLVFPGRVIRQLSSLQDIPTEADRILYWFMWVDTTASLPDRFLRVREVRRLWGTRVV